MHSDEQHELQSALMLTVEFSNIYYTPVPTLSLEKINTGIRNSAYT